VRSGSQGSQYPRRSEIGRVGLSPRGQTRKQILEKTKGHYFYAHFYMAQGMYQRGGKDYEDYYPKIRDRLLTMQYPDGRAPST